MSIDRTEGGYAVCVGDDGKAYSLLLDLLPEGAKTGDILLLSEGGVLSSAKEETVRRRAEIAALQKQLFI